MKYGLPREEKPNKKWKTAIENELRCLQMEVCFLKDQLNEATKKLAEFTSSKPSNPFAFIQGFSRNENPLSQFSQNVTNNFSSTNKSLPPFTTDLNGNNDQRFFTCNLQSSQGNPFFSIGTERPRYQSIWDYDTMTRKAVRFHSITCMPSYKDDKSFEELRYEDYVLKGIGFSNQIQKYKEFPRTEQNNLSILSKNWKPFERKHSEGFTNHSSTFMIPWYLTPKLPKAPWPFGPSLKSNETSNSPTQNNIASGASDVNIESNFEAEQNKSEPIFSFQSNSETKNYSDIEIAIKNENLSSQVLLELRKIGENISSINDRLSIMDSNLSDVSSRVSVMDSRLSAVDMFVTMQRFDKKWQGLETRLAGLENPSPAKATTLPVDESINKDTTHPLSKGTTLGESIMQKEKIKNFSSGNETNKSPHISEFDKSGTSAPKASIKNEAETLSAMDTSDMNLTDFVTSISCTDITMESKSLHTSSLSDHSAVSDSSSKMNLEVALIEMENLKSNSLPLKSTLIDNSSPQENESIISYSGSLSSVSANNDNIIKERGNNNEATQANSLVKCSEITGILEETKLKKHELQINSSDKDNNNGKKSNDPLGDTEEKDSSPIKLDNLVMKEIANDADNEFVIVEKSDVEESLEENSNTKTMYSPVKRNVGEASCDSDFKMYSDITEYLEINLGKKKNLVYEFGFEAKPDYLLKSEESPSYENKSVEIQENKAEEPSRDDSFQQFKTNFIENKSVDAKQSSPFVFFDSKTPEESLGKNPFGRNC